MIMTYKNILNEYEKISYEEYKEKDDEGYEENNREVVVVNKEHRQSIIFHEYRSDNEEKLKDVCFIPDYISSEAYDYVCKVLNDNDNITVFWSQVYGTTSDYIIIYNKYFTNGEQCRKYLEEHSSLPYKYTEVLNETEKKCEC